MALTSFEDLARKIIEKQEEQVAEVNGWEDLVNAPVETPYYQPEPEPQPESQPEEQTSRGEQRAEQNMVEVKPVVEPVTASAGEQRAEENQPVVTPVTPKTDRQEEANQPEVVPVNDTESLYNNWEQYIADQERAQEVNDEWFRETTEEAPLVTPVQKNLGTYPAGTMDFLNENGLSVDWLNTPDGQYWLESRNTPQPEILFPTDYGGTTIPDMPAPRTPITRDEFLNGASDFFNPIMNLGVPSAVAAEETPAQPQTSGGGWQSDFQLNSPIMSEIDWWDPMAQFADLFESEIEEPLPKVPPLKSPMPPSSDPVVDAYNAVDEWLSEGSNPLREEIDRLNSGNLRATDVTHGRPVDMTPQTTLGREDVDPTLQFASPEYIEQMNEPQTEFPEYDRELVEQALPPEYLDLYDQGVPLEDLLEALDRNEERLNTVLDNTPEEYRNTPEVSYSDAIANTIADVINNSGINPDEDKNRLIDIFIEDNNLEDTPALRGYLERMIDQRNASKEEPAPVTGQDVKNAVNESLSDIRGFTDSTIDFAKDVTAPVTQFVEDSISTLVSGTENIKDAERMADTLGLLPDTPERENFINNYESQSGYADMIESMNVDKNDVAEFRVNQMDKAYAELNADRAQAEAEMARQELLAPNRDSSAYYSRFYDDVIAPIIRNESGLKPSVEKQILEHPENSRYNQATGRWERINTAGSGKGTRWQDGYNTDRLMDDLMLMDAPAIDENGNLNTAAQALFMGMDENDPYSGTSGKLTPEQMLHLFDKGTGFADPESGIKIDPSFAELMAPMSPNAMRNVGLVNKITGEPLVDTVDLTMDEYNKMVDSFLTANPLINMMYKMGMLSEQQIADNFFKNINIVASKPKGGSGSGRYGYSRYGGGGGYSGGGGGGGYSGGGSSGSSAKSQTESRINNIMKNWTF